jgi:hypothetical protein
MNQAQVLSKSWGPLLWVHIRNEGKFLMALVSLLAFRFVAGFFKPNTPIRNDCNWKRDLCHGNLFITKLLGRWGKVDSPYVSRARNMRVGFDVWRREYTWRACPLAVLMIDINNVCRSTRIRTLWTGVKEFAKRIGRIEGSIVRGTREECTILLRILDCGWERVKIGDLGTWGLEHQ